MQQPLGSLLSGPDIEDAPSRGNEHIFGGHVSSGFATTRLCSKQIPLSFEKTSRVLPLQRDTETRCRCCLSDPRPQRAVCLVPVQPQTLAAAPRLLVSLRFRIIILYCWNLDINVWHQWMKCVCFNMKCCRQSHNILILRLIYFLSLPLSFDVSMFRVANCWGWLTCRSPEHKLARKGCFFLKSIKRK